MYVLVDFRRSPGKFCGRFHWTNQDLTVNQTKRILSSPPPPPRSNKDHSSPTRSTRRDTSHQKAAAAAPSPLSGDAQAQSRSMLIQREHWRFFRTANFSFSLSSSLFAQGHATDMPMTNDDGNRHALFTPCHKRANKNEAQAHQGSG